jgi:hypothetical protein
MINNQILEGSTEVKPFTVTFFLIKTIFWLIPAFFFWYIGAKIFCYPAIFLSDTLLPHILPSIVSGLSHLQSGGADVITNLQLKAPDGRSGQLIFSVNTLKYAYGFPLLFAMTMATNRTSYEKMDTLTYGFIIIVFAQTWSICFEVMSTVLLKASGDHFDQITQVLPFYSESFVLNSIALGYQLGFLILPAVVPIIFWVFQHQSFLKMIALGNSKI